MSFASTFCQARRCFAYTGIGELAQTELRGYQMRLLRQDRGVGPYRYVSCLGVRAVHLRIPFLIQSSPRKQPSFQKTDHDEHGDAHQGGDEDGGKDAVGQKL